MPDLGRKYTCYSCHTKFYDLGKPIPLCPKCGADQRDADDAPVLTPSRGRSRAVPPPPPPPVIEEPEDPELAGEEGTPAPVAEGDEEEEAFVEPEREEEPEEEEEEDF